MLLSVGGLSVFANAHIGSDIFEGDVLYLEVEVVFVHFVVGRIRMFAVDAEIWIVLTFEDEDRFRARGVNRILPPDLCGLRTRYSRYSTGQLNTVLQLSCSFLSRVFLCQNDCKQD